MLNRLLSALALPCRTFARRSQPDQSQPSMPCINSIDQLQSATHCTHINSCLAIPLKENMIKIAIDPGLSGAIVIMEDNTPVEWCRMPTMKTGSANRVNAPALAAFIRPSIYGEEIKAYVELVSSMPGQGVASMFSFGHSAGVIQGVLGAFEIPVTMVTPSQWKKRAGLVGQDKDASRVLAIQMWPSWRELDKKGAGQAYADAALIAFYGD